MGVEIVPSAQSDPMLTWGDGSVALFEPPRSQIVCSENGGKIVSLAVMPPLDVQAKFAK